MKLLGSLETENNLTNPIKVLSLPEKFVLADALPGSSGFLRLCRYASRIAESFSGTMVYVVAFLKGTASCPLAIDLAEGKKGCPVCPCTQLCTVCRQTVWLKLYPEATLKTCLTGSKTTNTTPELQQVKVD